MEKLAELYDEIEANNVTLIDYYMLHSQSKASTIMMDAKYGMFVDYRKIDSRAEELCIIAHEFGHVKTETTHKVFSPYQLIEKHEWRADKYAVKRLVPWAELKKAFERGLVEIFDLAEHFDVTEEFMRETLNVYQRMGKLVG